MKYAKTALSLDEQADLLIARGLVAQRGEVIARLKAVNYYRLSGYLYPFRVRDAAGKPTDTFVAGTTLACIWRRYTFDRRLRIILLDAVERIEVAVRTRLVYHFVQAQDTQGKPLGPFGHLEMRNLPGFTKRPLWRRCWRNLKSLATLQGLKRSDHAQWLAKLQNEHRRSKDKFVEHFNLTYGDHHAYLPLWMACEVMTCETALQFANVVDRKVIKLVAADFGFPDEQLLSWTKAVFSLRNACAHHARIWNRIIGAKPSVPKKSKNPYWHQPDVFTPDRVGLMLTVCHHWLGKVSPTTQWKNRLFALFDEFPEIPLADMGIPSNWRSHPLWR